MYKLHCNQYSPIFTELEDLRATYIANCVFNIFLSYTAFMLNIVPIYAVGLFSQPLYTFFLINWLRLHNLGCNTAQVRTILSGLFSSSV